jgi:DNA excision repair protein ERCC-4
MIDHWWINLISIPNRLVGSYWIGTNGQTATEYCESLDLGVQWPDRSLLLQLKESGIVLIQDSREKYPLEAKNLRVVTRCLETADISILGLENRFGIEAKWSLEDLANCVGFSRLRFEKEMRRLASFDFARLLVCSTEQAIRNHEYRSEVAPAAILGSLYTWSARYRVPFVFCRTREEGGRLVELWGWYYATEIVKKADGFIKAQRGFQELDGRHEQKLQGMV